MSKLLAVLAAAAACATLAAPASTAVTRSIKIGDNYFVKDGAAPTVSVKAGTRVKWLWRGHSPHNVSVSRGPVKFKSKTMTTGSYSKILTRPGTYKIFCVVHGPTDQSMTLRVVK